MDCSNNEDEGVQQNTLNEINTLNEFVAAATISFSFKG